MRQRVMIAMALSCNPSLLIADEPTTALDVTIQAQIMDLILELKEEMGMAVLLITHDMGLVAQMADRVLVMYAGQLIEQARVLELFDHPAHPYTRALLRSVPGIRDEEDRRLESIEGIVPEHYDRIRGCRFARRCPFRTEICMKPQQEMSVGDSHIVRCCRAKEVLADG
jgi:peptide/nickel transport system ATP-binding protein